MMTQQKKVAIHLAQALIALDNADWDARDKPEMSRAIQENRANLSNLFTSTGYEFGSENCPTRIKQRRA